MTWWSFTRKFLFRLFKFIDVNFANLTLQLLKQKSNVWVFGELDINWPLRLCDLTLLNNLGLREKYSILKQSTMNPKIMAKYP